MKERNFLFISLLTAIISAPILLNIWKLFARDYTVLELIPHLFLDISITALFLFLISTRPLEKPIIYWSLFIWFCIAFFIQNWPESIVEWMADLFVLSIFGFFIFPRMAVHVVPYVLLGLFISYFIVLRFMLFDMNYKEANEILAKKNASETAKEFVHILLGYERNFIGREKYRYLLERDEQFKTRLEKSEKLHKEVMPNLVLQKISYLNWRETSTNLNGLEVEIFSQTIKGKSTEFDEKGYPIECKAKINSFKIKLIQKEDGTYRVLNFPEKIEFQKL